MFVAAIKSNLLHLKCMFQYFYFKEIVTENDKIPQMRRLVKFSILYKKIINIINIDFNNIATIVAFATIVQVTI